MRLCPKEKRRLFYGYFHGFESFCEVEQSIQILLGNPDLPEPVIHAMTTSLAIDFIRPFKQQGRQMRLDKSVIPDRFRAVFEHFETLRDKCFAHIDSNAFTDEEGERNQVLIRQFADGFAPFMRRAAITPSQIEALIPLVSWLSEYSSEKFTDLINEFPTGSTPKEGELYEVDIDSEDELPLFTLRNG
ncbi:hypothetical protein AAFN60_18150 [Roseibacillus persicicus]|uniref:hypothetical protein n=1 Tax=Roseibacillus persicicus TaxID=454148 RepID=UPI00398A54A9